MEYSIPYFGIRKKNLDFPNVLFIPEISEISGNICMGQPVPLFHLQILLYHEITS